MSQTPSSSAPHGSIEQTAPSAAVDTDETDDCLLTCPGCGGAMEYRRLTRLEQPWSL